MKKIEIIITDDNVEISQYDLVNEEFVKSGSSIDEIITEIRRSINQYKIPRKS